MDSRVPYGLFIMANRNLHCGGAANMDVTSPRSLSAADIVPFPPVQKQFQTKATDQQLLDTVLNNMSQGVLMFDFRNTSNI